MAPTALASIPFSACGDVRLHLAGSRRHYEDAFRLVHDSYCRKGLCEPHPTGLRVTACQLRAASQVFVATLRGEVICTQTLVTDSEEGLPIESTYPDQIRAERDLGVHLGEVTCLADRRLSPKRFFQLFSELSRVMAQFAASRGVEQVWVACHPNHARLYERRMAFARSGGLRDYPSVRGNPAVALRLDLRTARRTHPDAWRRYFGESIDELVLTPSPLAQSDIEYFASLASDNPISGKPPCLVA